MKSTKPNNSHTSQISDQASEEIPFELAALKRPLKLNAEDGGATMEQQMEVTGWDANTIDQAHTWVGRRAKFKAQVQT